MKYEIDKVTGYLRLDRPQMGSSLPPCSYGFIPRTYSSDRVAAVSGLGEQGDKDPVDVFLVSNPPIGRAEILVSARIVGGFRTLDEGKVDDKLIAVLENDPVWERARDFTDLPPGIIARIRHYLSTYKLAPGEVPIPIEDTYGVDHAHLVIEAGIADYIDHYSLHRPPESMQE